VHPNRRLHPHVPLPASTRPESEGPDTQDLHALPSRAAELTAQTYWAAEGRVWQLRVLADQTRDPEERGVLLDLLMAEEQRQATARHALTTVWGIALGREKPGGLP
jgi:hypothetical protein